MPQLNPSPWFFTLILTWFVFTTIVTPKITMYLSPNEINSKSQQIMKTEPWNWPWP